MATAFILINTEVACEEEVVEALSKLPEIAEVHLVYGIYDVIAKVKSDTLEGLKDKITVQLRGVEKIRSTMTMIAVD